MNDGLEAQPVEVLRAQVDELTHKVREAVVTKVSSHPSPNGSRSH